MALINKKSLVALSLITALGLSACDQIPMGKAKVQCNDDASKQHIQQIFVDSIQEKAKAEIKQIVQDGLQVDLGRLSSLMSQVRVSINDVRTTHSDEKSSKQLCEATLEVGLPASLIEEADMARGLMEQENIQQQAILDDLKFENNTLTYNMVYNVQPTDDGKKIYGAIENASRASSFVSEIITDILRKPILEELDKQYQAEMKVAQAEYEAELATQAKTRADYVAVLESEAKQNLDKANTKLNLVWNAATAETRKELLPEQKTWLKKRDLECKLKAQDSVNGDEQEVTRLKCETSMTDSRTAELKSMIAQIEGG